MGHVEAMSTFGRKGKGQGQIGGQLAHHKRGGHGQGQGDHGLQFPAGEGLGDKDLGGGERERKGGRDRDHHQGVGLGRQRLPTHVAGD